MLLSMAVQAMQVLAKCFGSNTVQVNKLAWRCRSWATHIWHYPIMSYNGHQASLLSKLSIAQIAPGQAQEICSAQADNRGHRTLCPQIACLSIAEAVSPPSGPRHSKIMCVLIPSTFTLRTTRKATLSSESLLTE